MTNYPRIPTLWNHVWDFMQDHANGTDYIMLSTSQSRAIMRDRLDDDLVRRWPVFWSPGSVGSYYVYVCRVVPQPGQKHAVFEEVFIIKYASDALAENMAMMLQRYLNNEWKYSFDEKYMTFMGDEFCGKMSTQDAIGLQKKYPAARLFLYQLDPIDRLQLYGIIYDGVLNLSPQSPAIGSGIDDSKRE